MTKAMVDWALPQLSRLLPIDNEALTQIITYSESLSKQEAAEHLKNLLGDSPASLAFISSFNTRASPATSQTAPIPQASSVEGVPRAKPRPKQAKPRTNIHTLPVRQIEDQGNVQGAYTKSSNDGQSTRVPHKSKPSRSLANNLVLTNTPAAIQAPVVQQHTQEPMQIPQPAPSPTTSTKTKVTIAGGTAMHGASTALNDLDAAIKSLEVQTNPKLTSLTSAEATARRRCNCMATRHPLLSVAPNCLGCGKIICIKEGLGPCTFCAHQILSSDELHSVLRVLKEERGQEKMAANNALHKRAEISAKPRAFTGREFIASTSTRSASPFTDVSPENKVDSGLANAKEHRDRLLAFQAQNAKRTRIHDEAADFDIPSAGTNMWASPQERAKQLKQQQKVMREMELSNLPEYEKRKKQVMSIDIVGNKVVKRMVTEKAPTMVEDDEEDTREPELGKGKEVDGNGSGGAFSRNPLLGALIRPTMPTPDVSAKPESQTEA